MHAVVSEVLSDGASGIGGQELERGCLRGSSSHDNGVPHGVVVLECLDDVGHGGSLLPNGDVDAVQLSVLVARVEVHFLVDDGVDGDGGLSSLSISNDQFSLSSSDGY